MSSLGIWGFTRAADTSPKAATLAETAMRLQPSLAEAHASRALIQLFWDWEWDEAGRGFARAVDLNPGHALIRLGHGHYLSIVGRMDEAIAEMKRSQVYDPLSPVCNRERRLYLAHRQVRSSTSGFVLIERGRYDHAIDVLRKAEEVTRGMPWSAEGIGLAHGLMGNRQAALEALAAARAKAAGAYLAWSAIARIHLGLAEDDAVLDCLERAVEERDALLPWLKFLPAFDRLHGHTRFQSILAALGL